MRYCIHHCSGSGGYFVLNLFAEFLNLESKKALKTIDEKNAYDLSFKRINICLDLADFFYQLFLRTHMIRSRS